ncbi:unnamed protein product [Gongylonema pulchrum]|uniref:DDE_Tnp_1_7 domain-containing protein n=1 Tax=Gongylonema pulchrum TaxID=637853 RepID=A0A183EES7_9BILA|nr:unnamed protein product [Gongylonema pulchrum]
MEHFLSYDANYLQIEFRSKKKRTLLERLLSIASHYVTWKWLRVTSVQSTIAIAASNRNFDYAGKTTFYIRIGTEDFEVATKEGQSIECRRDEEMLIHTIDMLICSYMLNTVAVIASKMWQWQVLHANNNATNHLSEPSPTLYMCSQNASRAIFMQFRLRDPPTIRIRNCKSDNCEGTEKSGEFLVLNYDRLIGSSLCRKIDSLCSMLKS